jgi:hypothetical protein
MKKRIALTVALVLGLSMVLPSAGYSWYYGHGYRGCYGGCGYWNGWGVGAAIAGGILAGVIVGSIIADQSARYYSPPPRRDVIVADPGIPYAAPDPAFIEKYGGNTPPKPASGEWVTVPGQTVNSLWVPEHKVWVPSTP